MSDDGEGVTPTDAVGAVPPPGVPGPAEPLPPLPVSAAAESVLPPPPAADAVGDTHLAPPVGYAAASAPSVPPLTPTPTAAPDAPDQQWPDDAVISPYIGGTVPTSGSYRVLTAVIVVFLAALLAGAIALIVYLAGHATLSFPSSAPEPSPAETAVSETEVSETEGAQAPREEISPEPLTGEVCGEFCLDIADRVGTDVVGADGQSVWSMTRSWTAADISGLQAEEAVGADYRSDDGELTFVVWRFADDDAAQAAQQTLIESLGEPSDSGPAFQDGTGEQSTFGDGSQTTIVWSKLGDGSQPWVMRVHGTGAVQQFYYALPL